MLQQRSLFSTKDYNLESLLQHHAVYNDKLFWTPREVSRLLDLSKYQVYWLIWRFRLDAVYVCGVYRVPWFSIIDYMNDRKVIKRQYWAFRSIANESTSNIVFVSNGLDIQESDPEDYYSLSDLDLPYHITLQDLAYILRVSPSTLRVQRRWSSKVVDWPEVYDFLIECEVINQPVFGARKQPEEDASEPIQLALF